MSHRGIESRGASRAAAVMILGAALATSAGADVGGLMRQGNSLYARGRYDEALGRYQQAEVLEPDATAIHFNLGNTHYRLGDYQNALRELELVLSDGDPGRRSDALYNMANVAYKSGQLDAAIQGYIGSLLIDPEDRQAKENLEFCLKKKQEQEQQPDSTQQQQQQQQQQQPEPRPDEMNRDQAERVLQAIENKEKEQQEQRRLPGRRREVEKDW